jgi:hypothetical protein
LGTGQIKVEKEIDEEVVVVFHPSASRKKKTDRDYGDLTK